MCCVPFAENPWGLSARLLMEAKLVFRRVDHVVANVPSYGSDNMNFMMESSVFVVGVVVA